jgi:hypothetical protein
MQPEGGIARNVLKTWPMPKAKPKPKASKPKTRWEDAMAHSIGKAALLGSLVVPMLAVIVHGQATRPDFSGTWIMASPQIGPEQMLIKQDATSVTAGPVEGQPGVPITYKLDGSESRSVRQTRPGDVVTVSKTSWEGNQLVVTSTITGRPEGQLDQVLRWSTNDQGQLVIEVQNRGSELLKLVYNKRG